MIITRARTIIGAAVLLALLADGCGREVTGVAVGRQDMTGAGNGCTAVSAPMTPIPTQANDEPRMLIPQPSGWEPTTMLDSEMKRFEMVNESLTANDFAWVLVALDSEPGRSEPKTVFDAARRGIVTEAGGTDMKVTDGTVCGYPAQTLHYTMAATRLPIATPATTLTVVVQTPGKTYAAVVNITTTDADNPDYRRAAETMLTGLQVLPSVL